MPSMADSRPWLQRSRNKPPLPPSMIFHGGLGGCGFKPSPSPAVKEMKKVSRAEQKRRYRAKYPERKAIENRNYWTENRDRKRQYRRNRKARERGAEGSHAHDDIVSIYNLQAGKCAYCRKSLRADCHVDHILALSKGGTNDRQNLQLTCGKCNRSKGARDPIEFAQSTGRLI